MSLFDLILILDLNSFIDIFYLKMTSFGIMKYIKSKSIGLQLNNTQTN